MFNTSFALFLYFSFSFALVGTVYKVWRAFRPQHSFPRPLTPSPLTQWGMLWTLSHEILGFRSLLRADKFLWLCAWLFHVSLLLIAFRHLRYFTYPVWSWIVAVQNLGIWAGWVFLASSLLLLLRRCVLPRVRYISMPSDYSLLILIIFISSSGLLTRLIYHTDIVQLKIFILSLSQFQPTTFPTTDIVIVLHIISAGILLILFPFSKLWHGIGLFFHPTRTQIDKVR
ncbi:MAG: hypothetical protein RL368_1151 [Pseudomonadota bacterium]|jgi:nitrate reductase gamma subunit